MLELSSLYLPGLMVLGLLTGMAVIDTQTVLLRNFTVPESMSKSGYSPAVVERRIADTLRQFEREARTRPETRRLALESDESSLELIAGYLNLTDVVRAMQRTSGLIEFTVSGNVVADGAQNVLHLSIVHRSGALVTQTLRKPTADVEGLVHDAAYNIMLRIDPQVICAAVLRRLLEGGTGTVDDVLDCTRRTLATAEARDRVWLHNLAGVAHFLKRDHAGAADAFRRALRIDPNFSPATLNVGVLFAVEGRHEEAIKAYQAVFPNPSIGESIQTYAAAYAEWGNSLVALGRVSEAQEKFAAAVRTDPLFAPAYFNWASSLPPGPKSEELERYGRLAERQDLQIYTENLVGVIRRSRVAGP